MSPAMNTDQIAVDVRTAASLVRLSVDSINKAIKDRELVSRYYGTKPLIAVEELKRWFDSLPDEKPGA